MNTNKIITRPEELDRNERVLYSGNHYISVPIIDCKNGAIKNINITSLSCKALVELKGRQFLFQPFFYKEGNEVKIKKVDISKEHYYLPQLTFFLENGIKITARIYADLKEKGLIYDFEASEELEIRLYCDIRYVSLLRFNSHNIEARKLLKRDKWLGNPVIDIVSPRISFAMAFGGSEAFDSCYLEEEQMLILKIPCATRNCFYISINSDPDGASTTLVHLRRKGFKAIYSEFTGWLKQKTIPYSIDPILETRLNENLFFNYFYSIAKDMESDRYVALTSRSPRYYVSGAFWERDSFLWSFPAIKLVDLRLHRQLVREMVILHSKNAGDHAHYIDGTVLYPGFELDQAASYFIAIDGLEEDRFDDALLKALERVLERIEEEYDPDTGLYRTFLLPSDDPAEYPLVTIDNVILWRGFKNLREAFLKKGLKDKAGFLEGRIKGIYEGIYKYLTGNVEGKKMFLWSSDGKGNYRLYNDPPGNLGLLCFYGFVDRDDPVFKNTIEYYYSSRYPYYFEDAIIRELACDHHPNTPSGLGLCGSILNPLKTKEALEWLKKADMDYGLLAESFDRYTGEGKTGVGFATGSGYLAHSLYHVLIKEERHYEGSLDRMAEK